VHKGPETRLSGYTVVKQRSKWRTTSRKLPATKPSPFGRGVVQVGESLKNGGVWENALPTTVLGFRSRTAQATLRRTREVLLPPKPKELDSTTRTGWGRAWQAT